MPNLKLIGPRITKILGRGSTEPSPPLKAICLAKRLRFEELIVFIISVGDILLYMFWTNYQRNIYFYTSKFFFKCPLNATIETGKVLLATVVLKIQSKLS